MKFLHMQDLYFRLPDDFEGGLAPALRALADYHEQVMNTPKQEINGPSMPSVTDMNEMTLTQARDVMWKRFWAEMVGPMKRRMVGMGSVQSYNQVSDEVGELSKLDLNTSDPDVGQNG